MCRARIGDARALKRRYNVERGKYTLLQLPERVESRPMPEVELIDMRTEFLETRKQSTFSRRLLTAIGEKLEAGEQVMLLHNRRGFSSFAACRSCGERVQCVNCSVTLTFHRRDRRMLCHYCSYAERVPSRCPKCQSEHIYFLGLGSERVEDELHREFPASPDRAYGSRHGHREAAFRDDPHRISGARVRYSCRNADDRERARHSERDTGRESSRLTSV